MENRNSNPQEQGKANYMQVGAAIKCGHCNPADYGEGLKQAQAVLPNFICDCECHKIEAATFDANKRMGELHDEIAGWEKRFDREFNTLSEMPQGDYVKSFIRTVAQQAYERGVIDGRRIEVTSPSRHRGSSKTHGLSKTPFYKRWVSMNERCDPAKKHCNPTYFKKGIKVIWKDFMQFKEDMYDSFLAHVAAYSLNNTVLDRKDNDGDYSKENCHWVTVKENNRNKPHVKTILDGDKKYSIKEFAELHGVQYKTVAARLKKGWSVERLKEKLPNLTLYEKDKRNEDSGIGATHRRT